MNAASQPALPPRLPRRASAAAGAFTARHPRRRWPSDGRARPRRPAAPRRPARRAGGECWVVVKPDETVVIRVARSEMGQGTLTGLAQLVAEELDCDWARSPPNTRRRARTWRATASGATSRPAAAAASASRNEYVRKGGAAARMMLVQAAAEWLEACRPPNARAAKSVITHMPRRPHRRPTARSGRGGGEADAAGRRRAEGPEGLDHRRQAGCRASTPSDKVDGTQVYGMDLKLPGHAERRDPRLPGLRRQGEELRRGRGRWRGRA